MCSDSARVTKELYEAIIGSDASTSDFHKLEFQLDTADASLSNLSFGLERNCFLAKFGKTQDTGFALPVEELRSQENSEAAQNKLERFLHRVEQVREYLLVDNGELNPDAVASLEVGRAYLMMYKGKPLDITLVQVRVNSADEGGTVLFFKENFRNNIQQFVRLDNLPEEAIVELFKLPD